MKLSTLVLPIEVEGEGLSRGAESILDSARRQARFVNPIWKSAKPNANDEIAASLHGKRQALTSLRQDMNILAGAGVVHIDGHAVVGNTVIPTQDPIRQDLAMAAGIASRNIAMVDETIARLRRQITEMRLATNLGSIGERQDLIDGKNLEIQAYKAQQLGTLHTFEDEWSEALTKKYQRDITINLSGGFGKTIGARPNLGSASPGLPKLPQTSR